MKNHIGTKLEYIYMNLCCLFNVVVVTYMLSVVDFGTFGFTFQRKYIHNWWLTKWNRMLIEKMLMNDEMALTKKHTTKTGWMFIIDKSARILFLINDVFIGNTLTRMFCVSVFFVGSENLWFSSLLFRGANDVDSVFCYRYVILQNV